MSSPLTFSAAVEGTTDEAVVRKILKAIKIFPGKFYGLEGKGKIQRQLKGFANAAKFAPWLVLIDLDNDAPCAPELARTWSPENSPFLCFQVAVHEIEAWLLADRLNFSGFFGVPESSIPLVPDELSNPKKMVVDLVRRSSRKDMRETLVPSVTSGRSVGPAYASYMIEFSGKHWNPIEAAEHSKSLKRCLRSIRQIAKLYRSRQDRHDS